MSGAPHRAEFVSPRRRAQSEQVVGGAPRNGCSAGQNGGASVDQFSAGQPVLGSPAIAGAPPLASLVETILACFGPATGAITLFLVLLSYLTGVFPHSTKLYASSIHIHPRTKELVPPLRSLFELNSAYAGEKTTVLIISDLGPVDWPASLFTTNSAERFGSGALHYNMVDKSIVMVEETEVQPPCMIVSRNSTSAKIIRDTAGPKCTTFVMADEYCLGISTSEEANDAAKSPEAFGLDEDVDFRQYDAIDLPQGPNRALYIPLGPRIDFWNEIQKFTPAEREFLMRSSVRPFVFNSVYSLSTSVSRVELARVLGTSNGTKYRDSSVTAISSRWTKSITEDPEKIEQRHYARILLQSVFTLSPAGHNPECYRTFEAIEAGSIPIVALDDFYENHPCQDSLWRLRMDKAPVVFLNSWAELPKTMEDLLSNPQALDTRQERLTAWYRQFMNSRMEDMEKILMRDVKPSHVI